MDRHRVVVHLVVVRAADSNRSAAESFFKRPFPEMPGGSGTRGLRAGAREARVAGLNHGTLVLRIARNAERPG